MPLLCRLVLLLAVTWAVARGQDPFADCPPDDACRADPQAAICSGAGLCVCGECTCNQRANPDEIVSGRYCECDNFTCERFGGLACGGPERGRCECGRCLCEPGWSGTSCGCSTSTAACMEPGSDRVCSGKGECICGRCRCFEHGGEAYAGPYCEVCPTCPGKCEALRPCVQCRAFNSGPLKDDCEAKCRSVSISVVDEAKVTAPGDRLCSFFTEEGCRYHFVYGRDGSARVSRELECPRQTQQRVVVAPSDADPKGAGAANAGGLPAVAVAAMVALMAARWQ